MIHLTIKTTENYITVVDTKNLGRCYNVPKIKKMTEVGIFRLFMDLLVKTWMNPQTLMALKNEILKEYPDVRPNWDAIFSIITREFENREQKSFHCNTNKAYNPYRLG